MERQPGIALACGGIVIATCPVHYDGGVAVSDASGGDDNVAGALGGQTNAGYGGPATSSANGGTIEVGEVNSGGNTGNVIAVGN